MFSVQIQTSPINLHDGGLPLAETNAPATPAQTGAQVRFVGTVRNDARSSALTHLVLEHFAGVTEAEIERIVAEARQRWDLQLVRVVHRVGKIAVGDDIVLVDTASKHRLAAYEANAFIMDYLKTEAPFWKQECFGDGSAHWVEAKASDQHIVQRWQASSASKAPSPKIAALVLAGGQGSRMGYVNKGLQMLAGKPLVAHVIERLAPQVDQVLISANTDVGRYQHWGLPVYQDLASLQGQGPAAGILSASAHLPADLDAVLIVPCDTPYLPSDLVERLWQRLTSTEAASVAATMAATASGPHPSIVLCRPAALLRLWAHVQQHPNPSLRSWLEPLGTAQVRFEDEHAFTNINDLATLAHEHTAPIPTTAQAAATAQAAR